MVVVGKVVGGDDVDAGILLDLPVGETEPLGLGEEFILGELASPVGLVGLFEITEDTNAALGGGLAFGGLDSGRLGKDLRKPQHGGGHHLDCGGEEGQLVGSRRRIWTGAEKEEASAREWMGQRGRLGMGRGGGGGGRRRKKAGGGGGAPNKGTGEGGAPEWRDEKRCGEKSSTRPVSVSVQCVLVSRRGSGT